MRLVKIKVVRRRSDVISCELLSSNQSDPSC